MEIKSSVIFSSGKISGWVVDEANLEAKVKLCCVANGKPLFQFVADLAIPNMPVGHAFTVDLTAILKRLREEQDGEQGSFKLDICILETLLPLKDGQFDFSLENAEQIIRDFSSEVTCVIEDISLEKISGYIELSDSASSENSFRKIELFLSSVPFENISANLIADSSRRYEFTADISDKGFQDIELLKKELLLLDVQSGVIFSYQKPSFTHIQWDAFVGRTATGWAVLEGKGAQNLCLFMGPYKVGKLLANTKREDVGSELQLEFDNVGFWQDLGGLLQFATMNGWKHKFKLGFEADPDVSINIKPEVKESLTFSPMNLTIANRNDKFPFVITQANYRHGNIFEIYFKNESPSSNLKFHVAGFQVDNQGVLTQVMSTIVASEQEIFRFKGKLISGGFPLLILVTDAKDGSILFNDCIPIPSLLHVDMELLIELHGLFVNWQRPLAVVRKMQRHWLEYQIKMQATKAVLAKASEKSLQFPMHLNTELVLFSRTPNEQMNLSSYGKLQESLLIDKLHILEVNDGKVFFHSSSDDQSLDVNKKRKKSNKHIKQLLEESTAEYFLFAEYGVDVRPDYWAVITEHWIQNSDTSVVTGNFIQFDGSSKPNYINHKPLALSPGNNHLPINLALFSRKALLNLLATLDGKLTKADVYPEQLIARMSDKDNLHLRLPLSLIRELPATEGDAKFLVTRELATGSLFDDQIFGLLANKGDTSSIKAKNKAKASAKGISVVINFRNAAEVTNKAISSLRLQDYDGPIELLLVNNDSHPNFRSAVLNHAVNLFGEDSVRLIDYPKVFNHSDQCNVAVAQASHPLVLMLSNDAVLISNDCLSLASKILEEDRVATCGFRILRQGKDSYMVESLGLRLGIGGLAAMGGRLLVRNEPLMRHLNCTIRAAGNTFAAAIIRKDLYLELNGLDKSNFPTNYNDVDFSLRASAKGYIHVALGNCIVQHSGRGTREPDLDFPSNPKILASLGNLDEPAQSYNFYDFGDIKVF